MAVRIVSLPSMLGVSIAVHVALLVVQIEGKIASPQQMRQAMLDVVLVNRKTAYAPQEPQALAQSDLVGGGDAEDERMAATPFAYDAAVASGTENSSARQRIAYLELQQRLLQAQVKTELAMVDERIQRSTVPVEPGSELFERQRLLRQDLGRIERFLEQQNKGPKRRYITPSTRQAVFAEYYDRLKQRIEAVGTKYFPTDEQGQRLYGELVVSLTVRANGRLRDVQVSSSSGIERLDRQARAIARAAAPFQPFDAALRAQADELVVISTFRFTRAGQLESTMHASDVDSASQPQPTSESNDTGQADPSTSLPATQP